MTPLQPQLCLTPQTPRPRRVKTEKNKPYRKRLDGTRRQEEGCLERHWVTLTRQGPSGADCVSLAVWPVPCLPLAQHWLPNREQQGREGVSLGGCQRPRS